jgi:hypothetical protein
MGHRIGRFVPIALAVFVAACASNVKTAGTEFTWSSSVKRVVLVQPDVELGSLQASGETEVRADWTDTAKTFIRNDISEVLAGKGAQLVNAGDAASQREIQIGKLHGAVGRAILTYAYGDLPLPNKGKALDWSLGPGTNEMRQRYGADYALFVYIRDSYTSTGRAALIVGAALLGVAVPGGQQVGFASLVDLRTGNIVWFNIIANDTGDLRTEGPAKKVVADLIKELPL